jgi:hypothetical protein
MLAAGKVTTDQAERLMAALGRDDSGGATTAVAIEPRSMANVKYLRVLVDGTEEGHPLKVNIRVPLQLLRAGVRLASLIPARAQGAVNEALRQEGLSVDLSQIKPENIEELIDALRELTVEVDTADGSDPIKVRVFCE